LRLDTGIDSSITNQDQTSLRLHQHSKLSKTRKRFSLQFLYSYTFADSKSSVWACYPYYSMSPNLLLTLHVLHRGKLLANLRIYI